jgi:cytochrome c553
MHKPAILILALACVSCAAPERTRNLNDARVAAPVMAAQVCSNCHGIDGNSTSPNFPRLSGQTEPYLVEQLKAFRAHGRLDPAGFEYMWGLSRHLTDAQVEGLAAHFSRQAPTPNPARADPSLVASGKAIFENGKPDKNLPACKVCHGDRAQGNAAFPRLAGQHADYLEKQLLVFQRTDQRPEGAVMKTIAHLLDESDIRAVSAYLEAMS